MSEEHIKLNASVVEWMRDSHLAADFQAGVRRDQETYDAHNRVTLRRLNAENGVVESVDALRGWHIVSADHYKPGVYRIFLTRHLAASHGFIRKALLTTAIEQGVCSRPAPHKGRKEII